MAKIFENLWVKIAAVILAILLWFHVVTEKVYQHEIILPLTSVDITGELVISEPPPDSVAVNVSATGKTLLRTDWKKRGLRLLVNRSHPGRFKIDLSTENLSLVNADKVELVSVLNPREIYLNCDRKAEKELPVKSRIVIVPDEGYAANNSDSLVPSTVKLTGPNRVMSSITYIETEKKIYESVRNNFAQRIALTIPDLYGLICEPDSVTAYFNIVPVKRKSFSGIRIHLINSPSDTEYNLEPSDINLVISGKSNLVDSLDIEMISAIADFRLKDRAGVVPVQVLIQGNVNLVSKSVDSARIIEKK